MFLKSIADPESEATQYNAAHLEDQKISYKILDIEKVNDFKYEVEISKIQNGIQYPVIPYDVVLENGTWKFDPSNIVISPKDVVDKSVKSIRPSYVPYSNVVSENENFVVGKILETDEISTKSWETYTFNSYSADIYSPGSLRVESMPGTNDEKKDEYNFVVANIYKKDNGENYLMDSEILNAYNNDNVTFSGYYGYHKIWCGNFNYPWLPGKYNVVW